jgi:hypothetical protein
MMSCWKEPVVSTSGARPSRVLALLLCPLLACGSDGGSSAPQEVCELEDGAEVPDSLSRIGCRSDFDALASEPLSASIPGARSVKVILDQIDDTLYFQNSKRFKIHSDFAAAHLSGNGRPIVGSDFALTEYYVPHRRFLLGAVTYYESVEQFVLEMAPYDTASAQMIEKLYEAVKQHMYVGDDLAFHPTSESVEAEASDLSDDVPLITTDDLFEALDYQPLNLGTAIGKLRFLTAEELATTYVSFRDIVVLDHVPNDISVVMGMITEEFQTPLSHVNVLAQTRNTPNMGLRGATENQKLLALDGKWVRLSVGAFEWDVEEATTAEADEFWEERRPEPIVLPPFDDSVTELLDIEDIVVEEEGVSLRDALRKAILAFGGKASHYSILAKTEGVPVRKAFGVPVHYYVQFMEQNGLYDLLDQMLADPAFADDPAVRDARLLELRDGIMAGEVDAEFQALLRTKMETDFPALTMRFRSSTNSEDLDGFPCAGCYESHTGDPADWADVLDAVKETWSSIWLFRTFEERSYHGIDHRSVAMALLAHHNFPNEEANGVAVTANPYDTAELEPGFFVNVQFGGDAEVVHPPPGVTSDQFILYYTMPNEPTVYLSHSNLIPEGETVLTRVQIHELRTALEAIHQRFMPAYGKPAGNTGFYGLEVDFKFDDEDADEPKLLVKQARPHPGRGQAH